MWLTSTISSLELKITPDNLGGLIPSAEGLRRRTKVSCRRRNSASTWQLQVAARVARLPCGFRT